MGNEEVCPRGLTDGIHGVLCLDPKGRRGLDHVGHERAHPWKPHQRGALTPATGPLGPCIRRAGPTAFLGLGPLWQLSSAGLPVDKPQRGSQPESWVTWWGASN